MATAACILFGFRMLKTQDVAGKSVLEVGSRDVNGSLRPIVESLQPSEYTGVDIESGAGVDRICEAGHLVETFGEEAFDVVISTELLEHVRDWRSAVSNMKRVCRQNGVILLTTRSPGFYYHAYPFDFWRYEPEDIQAIFSDMELVALERDAPESPGVMAKVRKPSQPEERNLSDICLYTVIGGQRTRDLDDRSISKFLRRMRIRRDISRLAAKVMGT